MHSTSDFNQLVLGLIFSSCCRVTKMVMELGCFRYLGNQM
jgi:hypothetical protein